MLIVKNVQNEFVLWEFWHCLIVQLICSPEQKGDANDGKPDAFRISKSEKVQIWLEFQYYGWFGMFFENIQVEPPKEARGQS